MLLAVPDLLQAEDDASTDGVRFTFLGNEGFLVEGKERKVLIDALVDGELPTYIRQPEDLKRRLVSGAAPYDADLILATHVHGDHFGPQAVGRHLVNNPGARFVSTPEAVRRVAREFADSAKIKDRLIEIYPDDGKEARFPELGLTVIRMHHGTRSGRPRNNGYVFVIDGVTILHMGDTEETAAELARDGLVAKKIDVALIPGWYFDASPWKGAIEKSIRPKDAVAMHFAPRWWKEARTSFQRESRARVERIRKERPRTVIFEKIGETRVWKDGFRKE